MIQKQQLNFLQIFFLYVLITSQLFLEEIRELVEYLSSLFSDGVSCTIHIAVFFSCGYSLYA